MLTQIYEVSTAQDADANSAIGVDHVGVLVGDGAFPRELNRRAAAEVIAAVRAPSRASALFLSADLSLIETLARALRPAIVHLGAASELLRPADVSRLRKALPNVLFMRRLRRRGGIEAGGHEQCAALARLLVWCPHS
jgi:phosphoribosylanthranilate isomerase